MPFAYLAFFIDELTDAIHRRLVLSHLLFNYIRRLQPILLPFQTAFDSPIQDARQFSHQLVTKVFVLFFS